MQHVAGVNSFSDISWDSFSATKVMRGKQSEVPARRAVDLSKVRAAGGARADRKLLGDGRKLQAPARVDWVAAGMTTPVRDQGECGCCWAFAATTAIESALLLSGRVNVSAADLALSQQELLDCVNPSTGYWHGYGCDGGWPEDAIDFAAQHGLVKASLSPYRATASPSCPNSYLGSDMPTATNDKGVKLSGPSKQVLPERSRAAFMAAVAVQPVAFAFMADPSWQHYRSGIYVPTTCTSQTNHIMVAVGYDTSVASQPYWLVQNSWGAGWGENGYAQIAMSGDGDGPCGMYLYGYYPGMDFSVIPSSWRGPDTDAPSPRPPLSSRPQPQQRPPSPARLAAPPVASRRPQQPPPASTRSPGRLQTPPAPTRSPSKSRTPHVPPYPPPLPKPRAANKTPPVPAPLPRTPQPPHLPSGSRASCRSTLLRIEAWCCRSVGDFDVASTAEQCAEYCGSSGSIAPFCYDFNAANKHCACSMDQDSLCGNAVGYSAYTYSCS